MHVLARICVNRPVFATVLSLTLVVVGVAGYLGLGVDRMPNVEFPFVVVQTILPGSSPEEVETEITDKIERQVNTVAGIENLSSTSSEGMSLVLIQFDLNKDADVAAEEVRAKVGIAKADLPPDAREPLVLKFDVGAVPVISYVVSSPEGPRETYEYVDKVLRRRVESVNGVGQVDVIGGRQRQINVTLDAHKLQAYGLTAADVAGALGRQNTQIPGGLVEQGDTEMTLRTMGRVTTMEGFGELPLRSLPGAQILLREVAQVEDGQSRATSVASVDGKEAVILSVVKQSDANAVAVIDAVKERMATVELPPGYETLIYQDQSVYINASLNAVREHLILGSLLAALVVFVFLNTAGMTLGAWIGVGVAVIGVIGLGMLFHMAGLALGTLLVFVVLSLIPSARPTVIAALSIPTSIIATFMLMKVLGFTQNAVTMLALTLSVGIVIDDAIVVLENIFRVIEEEGLPPKRAAIKATKEIGLAVLSITISLIMVFLPVAFMSGIVGRFLNSFGITMACAVAVSLFVSFSLTPMLASRWLPGRLATDRPDAGGHDPHLGGEASSKRGWFNALEEGYRSLLLWSINHWGWVVLVCIIVFLSSAPLAMMARKNFFPEDDQSQFSITVRTPEGTSLSGTRAILEDIADQAWELPEVKNVVVTVGSGQQSAANDGQVFVQLNEVEDRADRHTTQFDLMANARETILPRYEGRGLTMAVTSASVVGGGHMSGITMAITGPDIDRLTEYSARLVSAVRQLPGVADADSSLIAGKPELRAIIDRQRAADLGVDVSALAQTLRLAVAGDDKITSFDEGGEQFEVHIRLAEEFRDSAVALETLTVPSSIEGQSATVTLDQVVRFEQATSPASIERYNRQRQFELRANTLPGTSQAEITKLIEEEIEKLGMEPEYGFDAVGQQREFQKMMGSFIMAGLLSFIFMYLVIAAQFESFVDALVIMITLPLTFPFALFSIIITGDALNIFSMLGMLVLLGVVKKNAILQIDRANQLRGQGLDLVTATVQAARDRLRPIIMTTLAFVAGMMPLVLSRGTGAATNRSTGGVIVGGQLLSLLLTLVAAPVFFVLAERLLGRYVRMRDSRRERAGHAPSAEASHD
ncbi:MAG TPA: AcrB/AcrD/AcrF family protein [Armatimonadetes bacterium]|nr:AcrB/AcrD/AcrF family protein [Armatimonadota bacterium]